MVQMSQKEQDIQMMLAAGCHLGTKNVNFQMERYGAFCVASFYFLSVSFCLFRSRDDDVLDPREAPNERERRSENFSLETRKGGREGSKGDSRAEMCSTRIFAP